MSHCDNDRRIQGLCGSTCCSALSSRSSQFKHSPCKLKRCRSGQASPAPLFTSDWVRGSAESHTHTLAFRQVITCRSGLPGALHRRATVVSSAFLSRCSNLPLDVQRASCMGASQAKSAFERISSGGHAHSGVGGKRDLIAAIEDNDAELLQQVVANNPSLLREVLQHANNSAQLAVTTRAHAVLERIVAYAALARCGRSRVSGKGFHHPKAPLSTQCIHALCACAQVHAFTLALPAAEADTYLPLSTMYIHSWLSAGQRASWTPCPCSTNISPSHPSAHTQAPSAQALHPPTLASLRTPSPPAPPTSLCPHETPCPP